MRFSASRGRARRCSATSTARRSLRRFSSQASSSTSWRAESARSPTVLVRRLSEASVEEWHRLRSHVLMDAGELGSRNMSVTWLEVPAGVEQTLHSDEQAEQVYVVVRGRGQMSVAGDTGA